MVGIAKGREEKQREERMTKYEKKRAREREREGKREREGLLSCFVISIRIPIPHQQLILLRMSFQ